ncbi:MAG TPA: HAD family hydrolase [Frankiaceae bacterium]|nr:HAD family hydrolase [Frankiaceae bacterium]
MPVDAVVFDLDGTLLDHRTSARAGLERWVAGFGVPMSDAIERAWFEAEETHFGEWRRGEIGHSEQRRRRMRAFLPVIGRPVGDDSALEAAFESYLEAYRSCWVGFPDVDDAVDAVLSRGLTTGVLTNSTRSLQEAKLAHLGLLHRIGPVVCAAELGVAKPHPDAFRAVCDAVGMPPERVLYVGDEHPVDVIGARDAGLQAVLVDRGQYDRGEAEPVEESTRIRSLTELLGLIDLLDAPTSASGAARPGR